MPLARRAKLPVVGIAAVTLFVAVAIRMGSASGGSATNLCGEDVAAASPPSDELIVVDSGVVCLRASSIELRRNGQAIAANGWKGSSDAGDLTFRTFEMATSQFIDEPLSMGFVIRSDLADWWVSEIDVVGASAGAKFVGRYFEAPVGEPWSGDATLTTGAAIDSWQLTFADMWLNGFDRRSVPRDLANCRASPSMDPALLNAVVQMTPAGAAKALEARRYCYSFRYRYLFSDGSGFAERWCEAPQGRIAGTLPGTNGMVIVLVEDAVSAVHTPRPQPPLGWGC